MRKIRWTNKARLDYFENVDYLLKHWSEKEAQNFIDEVYHIEFLLKQGNIDFQPTNYLGVRRLVIRKQITLFYRTVNDNTVEFLRFWNNYQDLKTLDLD
ncbi:type II toxin-antitoxin system RelE/ParE family toxin [Draconibacterium orientale]|uniref:type II toxin-antitoxin system RelE/ParE family toxin n=1 Tax=Draconibacterium orientale TaxID=1168034 RepID=UPI0029C02B47|nr:type II toxin-antitoxin system RelE/ParE family toxin [Draconibacterium orientale]